MTSRQTGSGGRGRGDRERLEQNRTETSTLGGQGYFYLLFSVPWRTQRHYTASAASMSVDLLQGRGHLALTSAPGWPRAWLPPHREGAYVGPEPWQDPGITQAISSSTGGVFTIILIC